MILGLILAFASALATNLAFLFKQRGAVLAPPILARHPLRSAAGLFRSRWFLVGWIVAIVAWGLHVGALSLAPLSIVQAVLSGGLVFLAVFAERFFGFHLGRRQWVGLTITAVGLAVIGLTGGGAKHSQPRLAGGADRRRGRDFRGRRRAPEGLDPAPRPAPRRGAAPRRGRGRAVRALRCRDQVPHPGATGAAARVGQPVGTDGDDRRSDRVFRLCPQPPNRHGVEVIAITSVAANLAAIIGGVLVFYDPIGSGPPEIAARFLAFCLVIVGAALMPAPMRAATDAG